MKCKISAWGCVYHACMSDDCQKKIVLSNGVNWGEGKCKKTTNMKAGELKSKQEFKLPGKRKFRSVFKVIELNHHDHIEPMGRKVCIILNKCKSMVLLKDAEVIVKMIIICLILASCSIQHQINTEWKSSPPQERINLLDAYYTIKENWDLGYERNQVEFNSIKKLIKENFNYKPLNKQSWKH